MNPIKSTIKILFKERYDLYKKTIRKEDFFKKDKEILRKEVLEMDARLDSFGHYKHSYNSGDSIIDSKGVPHTIISRQGAYGSQKALYELSDCPNKYIKASNLDAILGLDN